VTAALELPTAADLFAEALQLAQRAEAFVERLAVAELFAEADGCGGIYNSTAVVLLHLAGRIEAAVTGDIEAAHEYTLDELPAEQAVRGLDALNDEMEQLIKLVDDGIAQPSQADLDAIHAALASDLDNLDDPVVLDEALVMVRIAQERRDLDDDGDDDDLVAA
jgi:hypothetical protein